MLEKQLKFPFFFVFLAFTCHHFQMLSTIALIRVRFKKRENCILLKNVRKKKKKENKFESAGDCEK
jgi:hypothetical protein